MSTEGGAQDARGFDPEAILRVLARHDVRYVLIGGLAATLYGSPHVTTDVVITPETEGDNLRKLSEALVEMDARIRVEGIPEGLVFDPAPSMLRRVSILNLSTRYGDLDLTFKPAGTDGFSDLRRGARVINVRDTPVVIASLADVIRSKEAAGRTKDLLTLPTLKRLLERMEQDEG